MAEVLVSYTAPTRSASGDLYWPRALGGIADDGLWEGWIEFTRAGDDVVVKTGRETEQPNRADLVYWAQGLSMTYLEGALDRALRPAPTLPPSEVPILVDSAPRPRFAPAPAFVPRVVLDPFQTYAEGEELLRSQLNALSRDHLLNIIEAYSFVGAGERDWLRSAPQSELADRIVRAVRARVTGTQRPDIGAPDIPGP